MCFKFEEKLKKSIAISGDNVDVNNINENSNLVNDFSFTSINIIQLIIELENEFNIEFDDDSLQMDILSSYAKLVETLRSKLADEWL